MANIQIAQRQEADSLISVEQSRAIAEIQAQMAVAKRFPRDVEQCLLNIREACRRKALAEAAQYAYPRAGQQITGPSIRLAEVIAQGWQNLSYGIRELSQTAGESTVEAYAWDLQTNVRMAKTFQVKHQRKARGSIQALDDPRDIYEIAANQGARRLRACILAIVPGDITEAAIKECENTLSSNEKPMKERVRAMIDAFGKFEVTKTMIEKYLGHGISDTQPSEMNNLQNIYNSLKDGVGKPQDWFNMARPSASTSDLNDEIKGAQKTQDAEAFPQTEPEPETWDHTEPPPEEGYGPWTRSNWINIKSDKSLRAHWNTNRAGFKDLPTSLQGEFVDKWHRIMDVPFPQIGTENSGADANIPKNKNGQNSASEPPSEPDSNGNSGPEEAERAAVIKLIREYDDVIINSAKQELGIMSSMMPTSLDGANALLEKCAEIMQRS